MKKKGMPKGVSIALGITCTALFCFTVSGLQLDEEFEISKANPTPSAQSLYDVGDTVGKININTANSERLEELYGIGEKMAQRIIKYREQNGSFKQIEDIMKVQGIGKKTFDDIKDSICVSGSE